MPLTPLPTPPDPNDRATFNARAYPFTVAQQQLAAEINSEVIPLCNDAIASSSAAIATANYKGLWVDLSGPLSIPASVSHAGAVWLLSQSLADVSIEVPGISSKWIAVKFPAAFELLDTVLATNASFVEWDNFAALASSYCQLQLIGSNLLSDANSRQLQGQLRINGGAQSTWVDGMIIGGASHAQVSGGMTVSDGLNSQANIPTDLFMTFNSLGVVAYASAGFSTIERNAGQRVDGQMRCVATPSTPLQGVRIYGSAGTISGEFRLYGVRK